MQNRRKLFVFQLIFQRFYINLINLEWIRRRGFFAKTKQFPGFTCSFYLLYLFNMSFTVD